MAATVLSDESGHGFVRAADPRGAQRELGLSASVLAVLVWAIVVTFLAFLPSRDGAFHSPVVMAAWVSMTSGQSTQNVAQGG